MKKSSFMKASSVTGIQSALVALTIGMAGQASAINITTSNDPTVLTNSVLGTGITITSAINFQGSETSAGTFSDGSVIGFESGLILTSGDASSADGPNNSGSTTTNFGGAGNPNLDAIIPQTTFDATTLSFDFTTETGDLFFNYVFASEEYNEYVNSSFNDVFAFFVDDVNVALAPNGDPVGINTVNCGNPFGVVGPNCGSYVNNSDGDFDIEYDGFTEVFTASATGLGAGSHTFEFAIADAGDSILDSAVFIQGDSFSSGLIPNDGDDTPPVVPAPPPPVIPVPPVTPAPGDDTPPTSSVSEPSTLALLSLALLGAGRLRRRK